MKNPSSLYRKINALRYNRVQVFLKLKQVNAFWSPNVHFKASVIKTLTKLRYCVRSVNKSTLI